MVMFAFHAAHSTYGAAELAALPDTYGRPGILTDGNALAIAAAFATPNGPYGAAVASLATGYPRDHRVLRAAVESEIAAQRRARDRSPGMSEDYLEAAENLVTLDALVSWIDHTAADLVDAGQVEEHPILRWLEKREDGAPLRTGAGVTGAARDRHIVVAGADVLESFAGADLFSDAIACALADVDAQRGIGLTVGPWEREDVTLYAQALRADADAALVEGDVGYLRELCDDTTALLDAVGISVWCPETGGYTLEVGPGWLDTLAPYV